jgi:hypothetical protein
LNAIADFSPLDSKSVFRNYQRDIPRSRGGQALNIGTAQSTPRFSHRCGQYIQTFSSANQSKATVGVDSNTGEICMARGAEDQSMAEASLLLIDIRKSNWRNIRPHR